MRAFRGAISIVVLMAAMTSFPCRADLHVIPKQSTTRAGQMDVGSLAVESDQAGSLFVDGERQLALIPGNVVTLKLTAGQHFVELQDANGTKLWEKIVDVPAGAQVAERIELHRTVKTEPAPSKAPVARMEGASSNSTIPEAEPSGTPKLRGRTGTLEGYVRDQNGNPLPRASVWIRTGQHLENGDAVIPIVTQRVVGVISIENPPMAIAENQHLAIADNNGHFRLKASASTYFLTVIAPTEGGLFSPSKFDQSRAKAAKAYIKVEILEKQSRTEDITLPCERKQIGKRSFICEADSVSAASRSGNENLSLDATMKFIQTNLNELGDINFTLFGNDKKNSWTIQRHILTTNVVTDSNTCAITYHQKLSDNDKTMWDYDISFSLRDVQKRTAVSKVEDDIKRDNPQSKNSFRTAPTVFEFFVNFPQKRFFLFNSTDEEITNRMANAFSHAASLCGAPPL